MRDAGDTLFRSRNYAWIVNGRSLAKKIVQECTWCRGQLKETVLQRMGALPVERTQVFSRPFTHISVDLMGPFQVRGIANPRELENVNNGFKMSDVMDDVGDEEVQEEAVQQGLPGGGLHPSEQGGAGQELQTSGQHLDVQGRAHPAAGHYPGGQPDGRGHLRAQGGAEREESGGRHPEV